MKRRRGAISPPTLQSPSLFDESAVTPTLAPRVQSPAELRVFESALPEVYEEVGETFPGASPGSAIAVSTLTQTVKDVVEGAFIPLWVRGEISDFKAHRNGHWYFCLRDLTSQLKCVVWARDQRGIPAAPDDGMQVAALGQLGVYAARGEMQFTVRRIEADGDGLWRKALEHTRVRLEADGLLAPGRKRALPRYPRRIAFVTSASGAALRDVIAVLRRRAPGVELVVAHAAVQGEGAPLELCAALERVCRWGGAELVIIGRGGGSREDLWAFNDERVARAVAACPVPTISAVGHEVDVTLCDLVADFRAPTPSAAAETAVPSRDEMLLTLGAQRQRLVTAIEGCLFEPRDRARAASRELADAVSRRLVERQTALAGLAGRLNALSPLATLERGYAVARGADGRALASVGDVAEGDSFALRLRDGEVDATAVRVRPAPSATA
ncbi:MAG: Exodeoxyribonuclease 7 large subunit [Gemmatimonadetes bacterium]|nr:Exodeoxyribonuclease 7 large subunit [Gemmatimonadota bacterium]